jgi:hypothetical protein
MITRRVHFRPHMAGDAPKRRSRHARLAAIIGSATASLLAVDERRDQ